MTKHNGHRTTCRKAGQWVIGPMAVAALLGVALIANGQQQGQQGANIAAGGQQQDELFAPSAAGQSGQLDPLNQGATQQNTLQSQPPTGLEDRRLDQPRAQEATRQPAGQGRRSALDQQSDLDDRPMPPPRERDDALRSQHELEGIQGEQPRMDQTGGRGELGVFLMSSEGPGAEIRGVVTGSAADDAGLEAGDVILEINGEGITSADAVAQAVQEIGAGQQAMLQIWRDGEQHEVTATLQPARQRYAVGFRGEPSAMNGNIEERQQRLEQQLDRVMQELAQLRREMRQMRGTTGVEPGAMPPDELDPGATPSALEPLPPDGLDEPTSVNEPPGLDGTSVPATSRRSGTVSGAAGTTPVEAGSTSGPGVPPASTP